MNTNVKQKMNKLEADLKQMKSDARKLANSLSEEAFDKFSEEYIEKHGRESYLSVFVGV